MLDIAKIDKQWNKHEVKACIESILYGWNVLGIKDKTTVEVRFLPTHDVYVGLTEQESLKRYTVRLFYNSDGIHAMMKTALHEMVHVAQFRSKKLRYEPAMVWFDGTVDTDDLAYLDAPWEKEAYALEELLFKQVMKPS